MVERRTEGQTLNLDPEIEDDFDILGIDYLGNLSDLYEAASRLLICAGIGFAAGAAIGTFLTPDALDAIKQLPEITPSTILLTQHAIGGGIMGISVGVIAMPLSYALPRRFGGIRFDDIS